MLLSVCKAHKAVLTHSGLSKINTFFHKYSALVFNRAAEVQLERL